MGMLIGQPCLYVQLYVFPSELWWFYGCCCVPILIRMFPSVECIHGCIYKTLCTCSCGGFTEYSQLLYILEPQGLEAILLSFFHHFFILYVMILSRVPSLKKIKIQFLQSLLICIDKSLSVMVFLGLLLRTIIDLHDRSKSTTRRSSWSTVPRLSEINASHMTFPILFYSKLWPVQSLWVPFQQESPCDLSTANSLILATGKPIITNQVSGIKPICSGDVNCVTCKNGSNETRLLRFPIRMSPVRINRQDKLCFYDVSWDTFIFNRGCLHS